MPPGSPVGWPPPLLPGGPQHASEAGSPGAVSSSACWQRSQPRYGLWEGRVFGSDLGHCPVPLPCSPLTLIMEAAGLALPTRWSELGSWLRLATGGADLHRWRVKGVVRVVVRGGQGSRPALTTGSPGPEPRSGFWSGVVRGTDPLEQLIHQGPQLLFKRLPDAIQEGRLRRCHGSILAHREEAGKPLAPRPSAGLIRLHLSES